MALNSELREYVESLIVQAGRDEITKIVVGAVIQREKLILLLKRNEDDFMGGLVELPSGTVKKEEDWFQTLQREIHEETGLFLMNVIQFLGSFDYLSSSGKKVRQFNFLVKTSEGNVKLAKDEHSEYYWILPNETNLQLYNISGETKEIIMSLC